MEEKAKVNDIIFKELIKRGHSVENGKKVWNIADSKLWYLTPKQAQSFLDLEDEKEYKKQVTQNEIDLINENITEIINKFGKEPLNIIDIGCGDGRKAEIFLKDFKNHNIRYCPIDISSYMVNKSLERLKKIDVVDEVIEFQWNISDFDNIENISFLLRQGKYKKNLFLLLGNTLGNFEINEILYTIRTSMRDGDFLLIGNGLDNRKPETILKSYDNDFFKKFSVQPVTQLGIDKNNLEFGVRFVNSRVESFFTIKNPQEIKFLDKKVALDTGDQIVAVVSYKYNKDDFKSFLNLYFDDVTAKVSKDDSYVLALCKK
jgi:uncharacterized SAM-dependent methyltransferase